MLAGRQILEPDPPSLGAGLRERKAARTRLAIARALERRLAHAPLSAIRVEDLAADGDVSRMTFFNYFPTKEHACDYIYVIWLFELQLSLERRRLRGVAAIEQLFEQLGAHFARSPEATRRFYAYFAVRPANEPLPALGPAERAELAPDFPSRDFEILGLGALFMRAVEEARRSRDLLFEGTNYEMAHFLGSLVNGLTITGRPSGEADARRLFRRHMRRALGLPFGAVDGRPAVGPPVTPPHYRKQRSNRTEG
jgi:AcrR family transcriptional regulator